MIEVLKDPLKFLANTGDANRSFKVYWNSPTKQCKKHQILFDDLAEKYGIRQNEGDSFRGDQISILYDPGKFPALLEQKDSSEYFYRNGGLPQEGSLEEHMIEFKQQLDKLIPDENFNGESYHNDCSVLTLYNSKFLQFEIILCFRYRCYRF